MQAIPALTVWVFDHLDDLGCSARTKFAVHSLDHVKHPTYQLPSPSLPSQAMVPKCLLVKRRVRVSAVSDEASCSMRVECQEKRHEQMMGVPECLVRLLTNLVMRGCVHEEHTKQHHMSSDSTRLPVMDLYGGFRTNLRSLNVEKAPRLSAYARMY